MLLMSISYRSPESYPTDQMAMQQAMSSCSKTSERTVSALRNYVESVPDGLRTSRQQYSKSALKKQQTFLPICLQLWCLGRVSFACRGYLLMNWARYLYFFFYYRYSFQYSRCLVMQVSTCGRVLPFLNYLIMSSMCSLLKSLLRSAREEQNQRRQSALEKTEHYQRRISSGFDLGMWIHSSTSFWQLLKKSSNFSFGDCVDCSGLSQSYSCLCVQQVWSWSWSSCSCQWCQL